MIHMKCIKKRIVLFLVVLICLCSYSQAAYAAKFIYLCGPQKVATDWVDRTGTFDKIETSYKQFHSDAIVYKIRYLLSDDHILSYLSNANFITIHSHGNSNIISCFNKDGTAVDASKNLTSSDFTLYSSNAFSNVKICVLAACKTAYGDSNISKIINSKGAKCVIGFSENISALCVNEWVKYFNEAIACGFSVKSAIRYADTKVMSTCTESGNTESHVVYGDTSIVYE